ncbi:hypothetical protein CI102_5802 [Trichoderma harzianum]|nr:hypothetical protein CI102_5802 [Trichoderma harzianum]
MHGRINSRSRVAYGEMQKQFIDSITGPCGSHVEAIGNYMNQHIGNIVILFVSSRENVSCNFFPLHPSRRGSVLYLVSTIWAGMIQFLGAYSTMFECTYHDATYAMKKMNSLDDSCSMMSIRHAGPLLCFNIIC